jgi:carboxymethylenebutenolidase
VPDDPERALAGICPVVASFGARDRVFGDGEQKLKPALDALGVANDVRTYDDAGHSFMNEHRGLTAWLAGRTRMRAAYHHDSAEDGWRRMLAFFDRHLGAPVEPPIPPT